MKSDIAEGSGETDLTPTSCPICGPGVAAAEVHRANFTLADLSPEVFSARRLPDRIHYRMVRCSSCGLLRSDPVLPAARLSSLYAESTFDYGREVDNLRRTYGRYLDRAQPAGGRGALLEVGCGNGFFLATARELGYREVRGIEPSRAAAEQAPPGLRALITVDVMREGIFAKESFDTVCLFQVFDHLPDPRAVLRAIRRTLRPGGVVLCLNHNLDSISGRLLGERSPIIDIEHTHLYSPGTLARIFATEGFQVIEAGPVANTYSLRYLARLLPLPDALKRATLRSLENPAGDLRLRVPLGNLYLLARAETATS